MPEQADAIIIGAGLAGLVAAAELVDAGKKVVILEQEPEASFGGQAWWSFGGLFLIDSPEQRRMGVRDSHELARQDWMGSAEFDRAEDDWAREWAEAYLAFAAGEKRAWLREKGVSFFPVVGWAERGGYTATGHGNSVPRFHITWGTGPGILEPFVRRVREGVEQGLVELRFRHRVDRLVTKGAAVIGAAGSILAPDAAERGEASNRDVVGDFELKAGAVVVASGGIGGNHELVRENWPEWLGTPPEHMLSGVPAHVDGRMLGIAAKAKARLVNQDRMWHYVEGIENHSPCGRCTASASCPDPRACGSTRPVSACRCRCSPASTPSARSSTCARPATTTRGSCWISRSSRRSSRSRAASRTPTSPARACASCCGSASARGPRMPWRRSRRRAPTS
ncbi:hypothetical protein GCM10025869_01340 [Homoserinibacter gongjuensis]|uniref:FAD-dependent oxidoreductase 2 FAD-binding domain-containing protein n=1 Tax=Homoserinibacter gongjuensis TaxID=1162968 RepID=A0ABQ6JSF3_9MICO|nr:hypothetical protein GCM10025869_01340 [Homoserinibacter gongjuensis]